MNIQERLEHCTATLREQLKIQPKVGIVLGSGLGALADQVEDAIRIPYSSLEGFPLSTAPGHVGCFVNGTLEGVPVLLMQGRIHLYEGYAPSECVLPMRMMKKLGVEKLLLTNAAGACNPDYQVGDFCLLIDHISTLVPSPLRGKNLDELGPRFPDMTEVYDPSMRVQIQESAKQANCTLHEGIYCQFPGPAYETPAEIRMARLLGADMVGMSTVIEAMAAHHAQLPVAAISLVTNKAAGMGGKLDEQEVIEEGKRAAGRFQQMVRNFLKQQNA